MIINDSVLQGSERITFALRELYAQSGYAPYRMSKFEEYDLYARNKEFLVSDNVLTFTDTTGKLMALKPDVTLSIIKNSKDRPDITSRVYYNENVYRVSQASESFREIMQAGVECFGKVGREDILSVIRLAVRSLQLISEDSRLTVSELSLVEKLIAAMELPADTVEALYKAIGEKNLHAIEEICPDCDDARTLVRLISLHGGIAEVLPQLDDILYDSPASLEAAAFADLLRRLARCEEAAFIQIDFSVTDDINYYNNIVFKGYVKGIPSQVLSGGQYDRLMRKLSRKSSAIGFAVYPDTLERLSEIREGVSDGDWLNVALPKGRLGEKVYTMFEKAGFECPALLDPGRKLIFENPEKRVRYFWVKPSDVAIYVERGAADVGVAGKDILLEYTPDVFELADLKTGICRMAVAAPVGYTDDTSRTLRVATKFSKIAREFYQSKGREIDIIHLNGSIEIAPILKLSDVIVDIVETGTTLKENNLAVIETIVPISARLICNKTSFMFKNNLVKSVTAGIEEAAGQ